ncbi:TPA: hypothetical protein ACQD71_003470 [Yersinia enterocolitica]
MWLLICRCFSVFSTTNGESPSMRKQAGVRARASFDGGVYDMDNLRITTPKLHIDIHRGQ